MFLNLKDKYKEIETDLFKNQEDVFNRYLYYTHKYRGDYLNDVNVGLFLNEAFKPTAQIFLRNKFECIKVHLVFENNKIVNKVVLYGENI